MDHQVKCKGKGMPRDTKPAFTLFCDHDLWKSTIAFFDFLYQATEKTIKFMERIVYVYSRGYNGKWQGI